MLECKTFPKTVLRVIIIIEIVCSLFFVKMNHVTALDNLNCYATFGFSQLFKDIKQCFSNEEPTIYFAVVKLTFMFQFCILQQLMPVDMDKLHIFSRVTMKSEEIMFKFGIVELDFCTLIHSSFVSARKFCTSILICKITLIIK